MEYDVFKKRVKTFMTLAEFSNYIDVLPNTISKWRSSGVPTAVIRALESLEYREKLLKCAKALHDKGEVL